MSEQTTTLRIATLLGVVGFLGFSIATQARIGDLSERVDRRLDAIESTLGPPGGALPLNLPPAGSIPPPAATSPLADLQPATLNPNAEISVFTGVKPVGSKQPPADRLYEFDTSVSPQRGRADAPVTIVEFSDFQCSFCRKTQPTLARIAEVYGDNVRWVWKHLPLSMHEDAPLAHLASVAADNQGKFWEYRRKLFADAKLKPDDLRQQAFELGLRMQQFEEDLDSAEARRLVEADMAEAMAIDLTATPGYFVNGRYIRGNQPFEKFSAVINDELTKRGITIPEAARTEDGS
jgi:protein-disulfide isomerase